MQVVHAARMEWGENLAAQRAGRMAHKILFEGEERSPDNYLLALANEGSDYYSPRHRHPWDQVRMCLQGSIPVGRGLRIAAGEVGYFPEGVHYGPQQGGPDRMTLVLQLGGASGLGYLSAAQLRWGRERLLAEGVFEQGIFRRTSGAGRKNEDAYEAIWRVVTGEPLRYPKPRYRAPLILRPEGFSWRPVAGSPGLRRRFLGVFPERGLSLDCFALEPAAVWATGAAAARRFVFACSGAGECEGAPFSAHSAMRLQPGEAGRLLASEPTELFVITVPPVGALRA